MSFFELTFVLLGGLPLFLPVLLLLGEQRLATTKPIDWYFWINSMASLPHVYVTYARVDRKISEKKISYWWGWPCYLLWVATLVVGTVFHWFLWAATLINVWQSYHYLRQVYGVSRFQARGVHETDAIRTLSLLAYHLVIPLFVLGRWDMLFTAFSGKSSDVIIPVHMPYGVMFGCAVLGVVGFGCGLTAELIRAMPAIARQQQGYTLAPLTSLVVYYLIHYFGFMSLQWYQTGFYAVTTFHSIQYIALTWMLEERKKSSDTFIGKILMKLPYNCSFLTFWGSALLFGWLWQDGIAGHLNYFWMQASACLLLAVSAHHYTVDTRIWRKDVGA